MFAKGTMVAGASIIAAGVAMYGSYNDWFKSEKEDAVRQSVDANEVRNLKEQFKAFKRDNDKGKQNETAINAMRKELESLKKTITNSDNQQLASKLFAVEKDVASLRVKLQDGEGGKNVDFNSILNRIAVLETRQSKGIDLSEVQRKINDLDVKLGAIANREDNVDLSKPIRITRDFSENAETSHIGQRFEIALIGCFRQGTGVDCALLVRNGGPEINDLNLYSGRENTRTRAVLQDGTNSFSSGLTYDQKSYSGRFEKRYSPDVPTKIVYRFARVPKDSVGFPWLEIYTDRGLAKFPDVRIR